MMQNAMYFRPRRVANSLVERDTRSAGDPVFIVLNEAYLVEKTPVATEATGAGIMLVY